MSSGREVNWRQAVKTASSLNIAAGIWLILAPFVLGYPTGTSALLNDLITGGAVVALAASRVGRSSGTTWVSWLSMLVGLWLIAAPFVLGYVDLTRALWNDIILGVVVAGLALWSAMATPSSVAHV